MQALQKLQERNSESKRCYTQLHLTSSTTLSPLTHRLQLETHLAPHRGSAAFDATIVASTASASSVLQLIMLLRTLLQLGTFFSVFISNSSSVCFCISFFVCFYLRFFLCFYLQFLLCFFPVLRVQLSSIFLCSYCQCFLCLHFQLFAASIRDTARCRRWPTFATASRLA